MSDLPPEIAGFLAGIEPAAKRADSEALIALLQHATGEAPKLWGNIIGFGSYHYRYESGREGDSMLAGFSPRKAAMTLYLQGLAEPANEAEATALLGRLGKHSTGKGCVYVKKLSDIDEAVLEDLVRLSTKSLRTLYG